jgi:hypothetical protein
VLTYLHETDASHRYLPHWMICPLNLRYVA